MWRKYMLLLLIVRLTMEENSCRVHGCTRCRDGVCEECSQDEGMVLRDGLCLCEVYFEKVNQLGTCTACFADGCLSCANGSPDVCLSCLDPRAVYHPSNNSCTCPAGEVFQPSGMCGTCQVPGCLQCSSPHQCSSCAGQTVSDGRCSCPFQRYKPDQFGDCDLCSVIGCASCLSPLPFKCRMCTDPRATLTSTSKCRCPVGEQFDDNGICHPCGIPGCIKCSSPNSCQACRDGQLVDGRCECKSGFHHNIYGLCSRCQVGCEECSMVQTCSECTDPRASIQGHECICPAGMKMNHLGLCEECNVRGCQKCEQDSSARCQRCSPMLTLLSNATCSCPNPSEKVNAEGVCQACDVLGCASCQVANPYLCDICDAGATKNEYGYCVYSISQFQLSRCSQHCVSCQDQHSCTGCASGFYLHEQKCSQCSSNCKKCEHAGTCNQCFTGFLLKESQCMKIQQECHYDVQTCHNCDGFVLEGNYCVECPQHCRECLTSTRCNKCDEGWISQQDGQCISIKVQHDVKVELAKQNSFYPNYQLGVGLGFSALIVLIALIVFIKKTYCSQDKEKDSDKKGQTGTVKNEEIKTDELKTDERFVIE